jgi:hypothetical protein
MIPNTVKPLNDGFYFLFNHICFSAYVRELNLKVSFHASFLLQVLKKDVLPKINRLLAGTTYHTPSHQPQSSAKF